MSRGLGWLQRAVWNMLDAEDRRMDTFEIAATVYSVQRDEGGNRWVSDAQHAAVRRALASLARQGKAVRLGRRYAVNGKGDGRQYWANARFGPREIEAFSRACCACERAAT